MIEEAMEDIKTAKSHAVIKEYKGWKTRYQSELKSFFFDFFELFYNNKDIQQYLFQMLNQEEQVIFLSFQKIVSIMRLRNWTGI